MNEAPVWMDEKHKIAYDKVMSMLYEIETDVNSFGGALCHDRNSIKGALTSTINYVDNYGEGDQHNAECIVDLAVKYENQMRDLRRGIKHYPQEYHHRPVPLLFMDGVTLEHKLGMGEVSIELKDGEVVYQTYKNSILHYVVAEYTK